MLAPRVIPVFFGLVLLFSSVTLAGAPNPTPGIPALAFDGGRTVTWNETIFGLGYVSTSPIIEGPTPSFNNSYDLTIANLTTNATQALLCEPANSIPIAQATLYAPLNDASTRNATFVNVRLNATGTWSANPSSCASDATSLARFFVEPVVDHGIGISANEVPLGQPTTITVHVQDQFQDPIPDGVATITIAGCRCDASGDFGGAPTHIVGTGAPGAGQNGDYSFSVTPQRGLYYEIIAGKGDRFGSATFHVIAATTFTIPDSHGSILAPVAVPIRGAGLQDFGTATFQVQFDPNVASIVNVTNGDVPGSEIAWHYDANASVVTVLVTTDQAPGANGDHTMATMWVQAVGTPGSSTWMGLGVRDAAHSDGTELSWSAFGGNFRAGIIGDANGDGRVDHDDVVAIGQYVVGGATGPFVPELADANHDGRITGVDAMFVRQFLAGSRATLD